MLVQSIRALAIPVCMCTWMCPTCDESRTQPGPPVMIMIGLSSELVCNGVFVFLCGYNCALPGATTLETENESRRENRTPNEPRHGLRPARRGVSHTVRSPGPRRSVVSLPPPVHAHGTHSVYV